MIAPTVLCHDSIVPLVGPLSLTGDKNRRYAFIGDVRIARLARTISRTGGGKFHISYEDGTGMKSPANLMSLYDAAARIERDVKRLRANA